MTYREQLKKAHELGLSIVDLSVAFECDCVFGFKYTEEEFEKICGIVTECYLKSCDVSISCFAYAINELIGQDKKSIDDILKMSKWDLIEKASYYA